MAVTPSILEFLQELGAKLEFEYVARGYMFRKGRMKITVSKICKVLYAARIWSRRLPHPVRLNSGDFTPLGVLAVCWIN